jgi:putative tryptophan/tyrosine transport system substrate-binding protein
MSHRLFESCRYFLQRLTTTHRFQAVLLKSVTPALGTLKYLGKGTLLVLSSPDFTPLRSQIAELAISYRLPTMFIFKTYVEAGGILSYGAVLVAMHRQAATHMVKILKGTKVGDIPIEQPNRFELVVNLKTAKAIGIELPTSILLRADEVIK